MTPKNKFRISLGDDSKHEDLTAEIYYQEAFLAMVTQEDGFDYLRIEIYPCPNEVFWDFELSEFLIAVESAKARLWELRIA